jgi:hypothetical protein
MKRAALALILIAVTLSTLMIAVAYYGSVNHPHQGENSSPTASSMPTPSPSPTATPTPTPTSPSPSYSSIITAWFEGPLGGFGITSPSNSTYDYDTLTLYVTGQVIVGSNVELLMTYSLDGQERLPIPTETQPSSPGFTGVIKGSVALPRLSEGSHNITVFGDLEANGPHLAQATVYFTVHLTSP